MKIKENVERKFCPLHQLVQSRHNPANLHAPFSSSSHHSTLHILGWYMAPTWLECRIYLHKKNGYTNIPHINTLFREDLLKHRK